MSLPISASQVLAGFPAIGKGFAADHRQIPLDYAAIDRSNRKCISSWKHLRIGVFGQDQGEVEDQPAGILLDGEGLGRGANAESAPKDFLEIASSGYATEGALRGVAELGAMGAVQALYLLGRYPGRT